MEQKAQRSRRIIIFIYNSPTNNLLLKTQGFNFIFILFLFELFKIQVNFQFLFIVFTINQTMKTRYEFCRIKDKIVQSNFYFLPFESFSKLSQLSKTCYEIAIQKVSSHLQTFIFNQLIFGLENPFTEIPVIQRIWNFPGMERSILL